MPFNFTGQLESHVAKLRVVSDGELITVSAVDGYTVTSTLSQNTAFAANPVRSDVGVWSVTMKDSANRIINCQVATVISDGYYLSTQLNPFTADSKGRLVLNWVFNSAGTPTDLPTTYTGGASPQFLVFVEYSESNY